MKNALHALQDQIRTQDDQVTWGLIHEWAAGLLASSKTDDQTVYPSMLHSLWELASDAGVKWQTRCHVICELCVVASMTPNQHCLEAIGQHISGCLVASDPRATPTIQAINQVLKKGGATPGFTTKALEWATIYGHHHERTPAITLLVNVARTVGSHQDEALYTLLNWATNHDGFHHEVVLGLLVLIDTPGLHQVSALHVLQQVAETEGAHQPVAIDGLRQVVCKVGIEYQNSIDILKGLAVETGSHQVSAVDALLKLVATQGPHQVYATECLCGLMAHEEKGPQPILNRIMGWATQENPYQVDAIQCVLTVTHPQGTHQPGQIDRWSTSMMGLWTIACHEGPHQSDAVNAILLWMLGPHQDRVLAWVTPFLMLVPSFQDAHPVWMGVINVAMKPGPSQGRAYHVLCRVMQQCPCHQAVTVACFKAIRQGQAHTGCMTMLKLAGDLSHTRPESSADILAQYKAMMVDPLVSAALKQVGMNQLVLYRQQVAGNDALLLDVIHESRQQNLAIRDMLDRAIVSFAMDFRIQMGQVPDVIPSVQRMENLIQSLIAMGHQNEMAGLSIRLMRIPQYERLGWQLLYQLCPSPSHPIVTELVARCCEATTHPSWVETTLLVLKKYEDKDDHPHVGAHMASLLIAHPQVDAQPLLARLYQEQAPYTLLAAVKKAIEKDKEYALIMRLLACLHCRPYNNKDAAQRIIQTLTKIEWGDPINQAAILKYSPSICEIMTVLKPDEQDQPFNVALMHTLFLRPPRETPIDQVTWAGWWETVHRQLGCEPVSRAEYSNQLLWVRLKGEAQLYDFSGISQWVAAHHKSPLTHQAHTMSSIEWAHYPMLLWRVLALGPSIDWTALVTAWYECPESSRIKQDPHMAIMVPNMARLSPPTGETHHPGGVAANHEG